MLPDGSIYLFHVGFWAAFVVTLLATRRPVSRDALPVSGTGASPSELTAPNSRLFVAIHAVAFGVMYFGLANAVLPKFGVIYLGPAGAIVPNRVPAWFTGHRGVGGALILGAAAIACAALAVFSSWRFRAKLSEGHVLATGGPFSYVRHPIYLSFDLLSLGTALWVPTSLVWLGFVLMVIGSDLRARSEERILVRAFGGTYEDYCSRTRRFVPGIY
jgi:protein-S-isoprenylcysteine O-methyltransferase Ste14